MSEPLPSTSLGFGQYVAGENHWAMLPRNWKGDGTKRCCISCTGWNGTYRNLVIPYPANWNMNVARAMLGIPTIIADFGNGQTWGNDTVQSRISSLFTYAQTAFGVKSDKCILTGGSMGTLSALNWARNNPTKVAAMQLILPLIDLNTAYTTKAAAITAYIGTNTVTNINAAYGSGAAYTAALPTHNPNTSGNIATARSQAIPTQLIYATNDQLIDASAVTAYAAAVGSNVAAVSMGITPAGHDISPTIANDPTDKNPQARWVAQFA